MKGIRFGLVVMGILLLTFILVKRPIDVPTRTEPTQEAKIAIPENPYLLDFADSLDQHIRNTIANTKVPGIAVVAVHNGNTFFKKAYGVKEIETIYPIDTNTVFRIASVSKGFAAALTGSLVEDGQLAWNDKVIKYLPSFSLKTRKQTEALEIRHLLSHTSGIQYQAYTNLVEAGWDRDEIIDRLKNVNIYSDVGEIYSYQNVAYSVIEPIIERITEQSYQEALVEKLLTPLNMKNASLTYDELVTMENRAEPHLYRGRKRFKNINISPTYYNVAAAGGVNASISDMEEYLKAMLGHRPDVVAPSTLDTLFKPVVRTSLKERAFRRAGYPAKAHYGMGWRVVHLPKDTVIYHGGYANGYRSGIAFSSKHDVGIVILTNSSIDVPGELMGDFFGIFYPLSERIESWQYQNVF